MAEETNDKVKELEVALARITKAGMPNCDDMAAMREILKSGPLCRVLCAILLESDNKLTAVGTGDLSNDESVKRLAKIQGEAIGLSRAVEYIVDFSISTETVKETNNG